MLGLPRSRYRYGTKTPWWLYGAYTLSLSRLIKGQMHDEWYILQDCKTNGEISTSKWSASMRVIIDICIKMSSRPARSEPVTNVLTHCECNGLTCPSLAPPDYDAEEHRHPQHDCEKLPPARSMSNSSNGTSPNGVSTNAGATPGSSWVHCETTWIPQLPADMYIAALHSCFNSEVPNEFYPFAEFFLKRDTLFKFAMITPQLKRYVKWSLFPHREYKYRKKNYCPLISSSYASWNF